MISTALLTALNYHAIACLHVNAGQYRPCEVTVGDHDPPAHHRVPELMNAFINEVNRYWETTDVLTLASSPPALRVAKHDRHARAVDH